MKPSIRYRVLLPAMCLVHLCFGPGQAATPDSLVQWTQVISAVDGGFKGTVERGQNFGQAVACLGDVNGDGVPDIAVGAPYDNDGGLGHGAVWVLFLNREGGVVAHQKISSLYGNMAPVEGHFGTSVAGIGDVNGDGVPDLAVGEPLYARNAGRGWVLFLSPDGKVRSSIPIQPGLEYYDLFGEACAGLGDLDDDGSTDIAFGLPNAAGRGAVHIVSVDSTGAVSTPFGRTRNPSEFDYEDNFGESVANVGDLDGDGIPEMAVGFSGGIKIFFWNERLQLRVSEDISGARVSAVGDLDGDGICDIATYSGIVFLNSDGTEKSRRSRIRPHHASSHTPMCALGDLDGDGVNDVGVGDSRLNSESGGVWIHFLKAPP